MPSKPKPTRSRCTPACTETIQLITDAELPPNTGIDAGSYTRVDGFRFINIFVQFTQETGDELPVDLGVMFAFDADGKLGTRRYVNLEANVQNPQDTNFIEVSGQDSWGGQPFDTSNYLARLPVMGPYVMVFVYNRAPTARRVTVWGYLVA